MVCVKAQDQHGVGINTRLPVPSVMWIEGCGYRGNRFVARQLSAPLTAQSWVPTQWAPNRASGSAGQRGAPCSPMRGGAYSVQSACLFVGLNRNQTKTHTRVIGKSMVVPAGKGQRLEPEASGRLWLGCQDRHEDHHARAFWLGPVPAQPGQGHTVGAQRVALPHAPSLLQAWPPQSEEPAFPRSEHWESP